VTPDEKEAIRASHRTINQWSESDWGDPDTNPRYACSCGSEWWPCHVPALLAEVDRLTAQWQRLGTQAVAAVEVLPRQMQYADFYFPETYDYETVGLAAVIAAIKGETT